MGIRLRREADCGVVLGAPFRGRRTRGAGPYSRQRWARGQPQSTAYLLALSRAGQLIELDDLRTGWRGELTRMIRGGIASFESLAIAQDERLAIGIGPRRVQFRPRPLSAAANYYLAARISAAAPFLRTTGETERLGGRATEMLARAAEVHSDMPTIMAIRERWTAELTQVRIVADTVPSST